jgi:signal transduction histidine kinase
MKKNMAEMEKEHQEQMEYYTMWMHQIKTPISAMELSLKNIEAKERRGIEGELFKIEQYVEMALHYVKIKQIGTDLVIREYEVSDILKASVKKYASLFINKKLSVNIEPAVMLVRTDSKWLSFLIEQILSNAIKYTNEGGIHISFGPNTLIIEDTGIGIKEEDMARIFEKGYTGYNGRIDKKASGIGLYLVKKVADSLAVKIHISSKVGQGTKVIFIFPDNRDFMFE